MASENCFPFSFTAIHKVFHDFDLGWLFDKLPLAGRPLAGSSDRCNGTIKSWQSSRVQERHGEVFLICLREGNNDNV